MMGPLILVAALAALLGVVTTLLVVATRRSKKEPTLQDQLVLTIVQHLVAKQAPLTTDATPPRRHHLPRR